MNSFIKNNKRFFSLVLGLLLSSSLGAITFRNEPLTNFIKIGEALCADFPENSFVVLEIGTDNFDIYHSDINQLDNLKDIYQEVMANRSGTISSTTCNISSNTINNNSSYLVGRERMNIHAKTSLRFNHCLLESPLISITGSEMNFIDSFLINPNVLNIIIDYPESDYDVIQVIFYDQPESPTVITGEIDLKNNQTTKKIIVSNVKEIRVQFIWDKSLPRKSKSSPELTPIAFPDHFARFPDPKKPEIIAIKNPDSQPCSTISEFIDKHGEIIGQCVPILTFALILFFGYLENSN